MEVKRRLKRFGNYKVGKVLGSGGFGIVYQATHIRTNFKVAMKVTRITNDGDKDNAFQLKSLHRETYLLANLKHPNIVRIFEAASSKNYFCIFMQHIAGVTLLEDLQVKKRYTEEHAKLISKQVAEALYYLHGKRVIHRDLKLENVMINPNENHVVLIDFGFATAWYPGCLMSTHCGRYVKLTNLATYF